MGESVLFEKGIFQIVESEKEYDIDGEQRIVKRTFVRRPPGVRAMIINDKKEILLSKEYRYDLECFDYRLPGGKVFDSIQDYVQAKEQKEIASFLIKALERETKEEVGIQVKQSKLYHHSLAGTSIEWDLYYFLVTGYEIIENGTELEENEVIKGFEWKSGQEIKEMCIQGKIHEERSVGVLLTYLLELGENDGKENERKINY